MKELRGEKSYADLVALNQSLKHSIQNSLYNFCHVLGFHDVDRFAHREIISCLEDDSRRKIICVPRGTLKSTIASIAYPIWLLLKNPNLRILIDSELYSNSITYLRPIS